ncbi:hypothetical protein GCM10009804_74060 [Kribbella hippodromi]|uniref:FHA domain-containing protein n=1 Tax=Kribbella hippodromi TaxID=434347 RepID=A0ABN2EH24_9ACTN
MSSVPVETRPSDAERDRALAVLRDGAGSGRLSHDTFIRRMNFVLNAQSQGELADAIRDLPRQESRVSTWLRTFRARLPRLTVSSNPPQTTTTTVAPLAPRSTRDPQGVLDPRSAAHVRWGALHVPPGAVGQVPPGDEVDLPAGASRAGSSVVYRSRSAWQRFRLPRLPRLQLLRPAVDVPPPALALPGPGSPTVRIGRGAGATLRMADISVSRFHAELRHTGEGWVVRDLGSMNGTEVNGLRITTPTRVRPGDHISFGAVEYVLTWTDRPST